MISSRWAWFVTFSLVASAVACGSGASNGAMTTDAGANDSGTASDAPGASNDGGPGGPGDASAGLDGHLPDGASPPAEGGSFAPGTFCSTDGWCWVSPLPHGDDLFAAWSDAPGKLWALGGGGMIARYDGTSWARADSGTQQELHGVYAASATDVWAVGRQGTLLHFDGASWSAFQSPTTADLYAVSGSGSSDVWAVGYETVLHWDGHAWTASPTTGLFFNGLYGVLALAPDDAWAVGELTILHWNGTAWAYGATDAVAGVTLRSLWASASGDLWAVGDTQGDSLFHYDPPSATWKNVPWGTGFEMLEGIGGIGDDAWAVGPEVALHYDGTSFTAQSGADTSALQAVTATSAGDAWAVGLGGRVLHATQASGPWSAATSGDNQSYRGFGDAFATGPDDLWLAGDSGNSSYVGHWDGTSFTTTVIDPNMGLDGVWASAPDDVWTVTGFAQTTTTFHHFDGKQWTVGATLQGPGLVKLWGSSASDVWAAGGGGVYHYDGTSWAPSPGGADPTYTLEDIHGSAADDVWAVGMDNTTLHWDGSAWKVVTGGVVSNGPWLTAVWSFAPGDAWTVDTSGLAYHWDGTSWSAGVQAATTWLTALWGSGPDDLWAVGGEEGTWGLVSHYDGHSWSASASGDGTPLSTIWGTSASDVWIAGGDGAVLRKHP